MDLFPSKLRGTGEISTRRNRPKLDKLMEEADSCIAAGVELSKSGHEALGRAEVLLEDIREYLSDLALTLDGTTR